MIVVVLRMVYTWTISFMLKKSPYRRSLRRPGDVELHQTTEYAEESKQL